MGRMRHRVHITVTAHDIAAATRNESKHCAVATAIRGSIDTALHPHVDIQTIRFSDTATGERYIYLTPQKVADYIIAFDAGDPIEPFEFDLVTPAYIGQMRLHTAVSDPGPEYQAIVSAPRDNPGTSDVGNDVRRVPVSDRRIIPRLVADREYGRRRLRANQSPLAENSRGL